MENYKASASEKHLHKEIINLTEDEETFLIG